MKPNRDDDNDPMKYQIKAGTVQAFVGRMGDKETPMFMVFFGRVNYDSNLPIPGEIDRKRAQVIVDALNAGTMTEEEAKERLKAI
jgi:hypothetical protein